MIQTIQILSTATNTTGPTVSDITAGGAFQAVILGSGTVSTKVLIQVSLDSTNFITLGIITLSGSDTVTDGFTSVGYWPFYRAVTSEVIGTVNVINVSMSEVT